MSAELIINAAMKNNKIAKKIFSELGYYLGLELSNFINILNPEMIILGGGLIKAKKILYGKLYLYFEKRMLLILLWKDLKLNLVNSDQKQVYLGQLSRPS